MPHRLVGAYEKASNIASVTEQLIRLYCAKISHKEGYPVAYYRSPGSRAPNGAQVPGIMACRNMHAASIPSCVEPANLPVLHACGLC